MKNNIPYWPKHGKGPIKFLCYNFVYAKDGEDGGVTIDTETQVKKMMKDGFMSESSKLLFVIEANCWVDAMQEYNTRMGYDPYIPMDVPEDE